MREKHKILIVDDEAPFRSAMRRLLGKTHIILEADTGKAGLMLAAREVPISFYWISDYPTEAGLSCCPVSRKCAPPRPL